VAVAPPLSMLLLQDPGQNWCKKEIESARSATSEGKIGAPKVIDLILQAEHRGVPATQLIASNRRPEVLPPVPQDANERNPVIAEGNNGLLPH
jgi:hypothetical protein